MLCWSSCGRALYQPIKKNLPVCLAKIRARLWYDKLLCKPYFRKKIERNREGKENQDLLGNMYTSVQYLVAFRKIENSNERPIKKRSTLSCLHSLLGGFYRCLTLLVAMNQLRFRRCAHQLGPHQVCQITWSHRSGSFILRLHITLRARRVAPKSPFLVRGVC